MAIFKEITYAYPSSANAKQFQCSKEGCFTVGLSRDNNPTYENFGPFKTIKEAESYAENLGYEWHSLYKRFPHDGSKFGAPKAVCTLHPQYILENEENLWK